MSDNKYVSLKDIKEVLYHLLCTGQITITQYIGNGLYNIGNGIIVNEKALEEIHKRIRESL